MMSYKYVKRIDDGNAVFYYPVYIDANGKEVIYDSPVNLDHKKKLLKKMESTVSDLKNEIFLIESLQETE